jgi:mRNA interferase MazF
MFDVHPFPVLSPWAFNEKTSLVIELPMTTAAYNTNNPFAVATGKASGNKSANTNTVLYHQPKSFDWRVSDAKPNSLARLHATYFE